MKPIQPLPPQPLSFTNHHTNNSRLLPPWPDPPTPPARPVACYPPPSPTQLRRLKLFFLWTRPNQLNWKRYWTVYKVIHCIWLALFYFTCESHIYFKYFSWNAIFFNIFRVGGGFEYKKAFVDSIAILIRDNYEANEVVALFIWIQWGLWMHLARSKRRRIIGDRSRNSLITWVVVLNVKQ